MHISRTEAKVVQAWHHAAVDLKIRFTSPFSGTTAAGVPFTALGLVHQFGRRVGTLIQVGGEPSADLEYPADDDYTWSCLGRTCYARYDRKAWIEMLNDWQFLGPDSERPSWYTGEPSS
jgi:hypothetical protein